MAKTFRVTDQRGNVVLRLSSASSPDFKQLMLPITPEEISITRPSRQAVTQTLTSAYQDHLGSGISTVTVRGHTGWRDLGTGSSNDLGTGTGYEVIKNLRDLLADYDNRVARGDPSTVKLLLMLNLPSGWEMFRVSKNVAGFSRSRQQPLLYRYELQFTVLEDLNAASKQIDPSPNFVITLASAPTVKLLTSTGSSVDPSHGGTGGTDQQTPGVTTSDPDVASRVAAHQAKKLSLMDDTRLLDESDSDFAARSGAANAAVGTGDRSVYALGLDWYSASVYPADMWKYIVAANPELFANAPDDPTAAFVKAGTTLRIPQINPNDAWTGGTPTVSGVIAQQRNSQVPFLNDDAPDSVLHFTAFVVPKPSVTPASVPNPDVSSIFWGES